MFHTLVALMVVLIFSMPFFAMAQQNLIAEAQASADAKSDVNQTSWFMTGCCHEV